MEFNIPENINPNDTLNKIILEFFQDFRRSGKHVALALWTGHDLPEITKPNRLQKNL